MFPYRMPVFVVVNGFLASGVVVCACLTAQPGWWKGVAGLISTGSDRNVKEQSAARTAPVRREIDAGHVGLRPVSFGDMGQRHASPDIWSAHGAQPQEWDWLPASPGMDMAETAHDYVISFSMPGIRPDDIRLTVTDCVVTVQAKLRDAGGTPVGAVVRRVQLPATANGFLAGVATSLSNGILRVCVAK